MMTIKIALRRPSGPPAKDGHVSDAELHFTEGPLAGLKLIGFAVHKRRDGTFTVLFPSRQYSVNGEQRRFALLRPASETTDTHRTLKDRILEAHAREWEASCRAS